VTIIAVLKQDCDHGGNPQKNMTWSQFTQKTTTMVAAPKIVAEIQSRHASLESLSAGDWDTDPYIYISLYMCACVKRERERLESFGEDSDPDPSHSNIYLRYLKIRFTPLKLIYIILSLYKSKVMYFKYFLSIHQVAQNGRLKVAYCLDLHL